MKKYFYPVISVVIAQLAGIAGSIFTAPAIDGWYDALIKPSFRPPNWIFAPVWTILYLLMGVSAYLIWNEKKNKKSGFALKIYAVHLFVNFSWSYVFFGMKDIVLAFMVILVLLVFIIYMIFLFRKINKLASNLLFPYLAWVSFASLLNLSILLLNR